jgi:hypothetical protein
MKRWPFLCTIIFLSMLTACGSSDDKDKPVSTNQDKEDAKEKSKEEAKKAAEKKILPICPQVAIIRELDDMHDYGTEKPSADQLVSEARMENVEGDCAYQENGIDITFDLNFIAGRGPRMGGNHASFPYFIAVVDPEENVLNKDKMTAEFKFSDDKDKKIVDQTEPLHVFIPLPQDKRDTGPGYQVLLGFQLTQEQLDATRALQSETPK